MIEQIEKTYDVKPIILIYDVEQEESFEKLLKCHNYTIYKGSTERVIEHIKTIENGILLLQGDNCIGIDTRFKVDSQVLIIADVKTNHELIQMIGRSSRTRGICESYMFIRGQEKSSVVMQKL